MPSARNERAPLFSDWSTVSGTRKEVDFITLINSQLPEHIRITGISHSLFWVFVSPTAYPQIFRVKCVEYCKQKFNAYDTESVQFPFLGP